MTDQEVEKMLQEQNLNAPRITPDDVEAEIVAEYYFTAADGVKGRNLFALPNPVHESLNLLTFCVLVLKNGFTVTGSIAPVSPENFVAQIGREAARKEALNNIWPLLGYELKSKLANK